MARKKKETKDTLGTFIKKTLFILHDVCSIWMVI